MKYYQYDLFHKENQDEPLIFASGQGCELTDEQGNVYLDMNEMSGILGQNHRGFQDKITGAVGGVTTTKGKTNPYKEQLLQQLMETTNGDFKKVLLTSSGSEAAEWAMRLAKRITGRTEVVSFWNSIHGRTQLTASHSGLPRRKVGYGPLAAGVVFGAYPSCRTCPFGRKCAQGDYFCLEFLKEKIKYESSQDIAAVIIEPYRGADMAFVPAGYLKALRKWTEEEGILLIIDEIQSGMGRTGRVYDYQSHGIQPDMLLLGKGIGNGMHINVLLLKEAVAPQFLPAVAGGSGDAILATAAATAVFEALEGGLTKQVEQVGKVLLEGLQAIKSDKITAVWGKGLAIGMACEDVSTAVTIQKNMGENRCFIGRTEDVLYLKPPLVLTEQQAIVVVQLLKKAVE